MPPYVKDGLIALYDGIKNRFDIGYHSVSSRIWSDLINHNDLILDPTSYFDKNSLVITTNGENDYSSYGAEVISGNWPLTRDFFQIYTKKQGVICYKGRSGSGNWVYQKGFGNFYCLRIYNRILSPEEIQYNATIDQQIFNIGI